MSDKLKIMQTRIFGFERLEKHEEDESPRIHQIAPRGQKNFFYRFQMCSQMLYYIKAASVNHAITRLKSEFGIDASAYCSGCDYSRILEITVMQENFMPKSDGVMIFVAQ